VKRYNWSVLKCDYQVEREREREREKKGVFTWKCKLYGYEIVILYGYVSE
jgi:hypothetical protein